MVLWLKPRLHGILSVFCHAIVKIWRIFCFMNEYQRNHLIFHYPVRGLLGSKVRKPTMIPKFMAVHPAWFHSMQSETMIRIHQITENEFFRGNYVTNLVAALKKPWTRELGGNHQKICHTSQILFSRRYSGNRGFCRDHLSLSGTFHQTDPKKHVRHRRQPCLSWIIFRNKVTVL